MAGDFWPNPWGYFGYLWPGWCFSVGPAQMGWTCPRCHRVWGPTVNNCTYCNEGDPKIQAGEAQGAK